MPLVLLAFIYAVLFPPINAFAYGLTPERFDCSNGQRYYMVRIPSAALAESLEVAQTYSDANRFDFAKMWQQELPVWDDGEHHVYDVGVLPVGRAVTISDSFDLRIDGVFQASAMHKVHVFDANADGVSEIALLENVEGGFYAVTVLGGCPDSYYMPVAQFVAQKILQNGAWIQPENFVFGGYNAWPEFVVQAPVKLTGNLYSKQKDWAVRQWRFSAKADKYTQNVIERLPQE